MTFLASEADGPLLLLCLLRALPADFSAREKIRICSSLKDTSFLPVDEVLIADSSLALPDGIPLTVISCGRSQKDTFTFSSKGEETASVTLMRAVKTPFGTIEPMEIPVTFPAGTPDFAILGTVAALVSGGCFSGERPPSSPFMLDSPLYTDGPKSE